MINVKNTIGAYAMHNLSDGTHGMHRHISTGLLVRLTYNRDINKGCFTHSKPFANRYLNDRDFIAVAIRLPLET